MSGKYQRDGTPYPGSDHEQLMAWAKDYEDSQPIRATYFATGEILMTSWMGLDMNMSRHIRTAAEPPSDYAPLIYEARLHVTSRTQPNVDFGPCKFLSAEDAIAGHGKAVQRLVEQGFEVADLPQA